ncbi:MAG TPA: FecR family protein [Pedobacter sp.]|uniref:FecR family protein n=1 Tax=Pedobacter sp. TaxID=1411316 RepID=UPI002C44C724|nr:FecR family protein [Pedobacter sp.]HMI02222.1 FecR family protein [Pedobacter sp.]
MQDKDIGQLVNQESFLNYCFKRNDEDVRYWEKWLIENPGHQQEVENLKQMLILMGEGSRKRITEANFAQLQKKIKRSKQGAGAYPFWRKWSIAAAVALVISGTGLLLYVNTDKQVEIAGNQDIEPGGHKATLILANGQRLNLADAQNGSIAKQSGVRIRKTIDGQIIYEVSETGGNISADEYNIIETPVGGEYQVDLPDKTHVWLNSGSSLRYPLKFTGNERRVELRGEGYFEVAHNKAMPFKVSSGGQTVEVLGTHFNVTAYEDEKVVKTTLLQGSVKVAYGDVVKLLVPGQQAQLTKNKLNVVDDVDVEDVAAWKNGYFKFNESLESIMNKISRWYGVEVVYQMKPDADLTYSGKISRARKISAILKIIEFNGDVHFKVEGRKVYVTK